MLCEGGNRPNNQLIFQPRGLCLRVPRFPGRLHDDQDVWRCSLECMLPEFQKCSELMKSQSVCIDFTDVVKGNKAVLSDFGKFRHHASSASMRIDLAINRNFEANVGSIGSDTQRLSESRNSRNPGVQLRSANLGRKNEPEYNRRQRLVRSHVASSTKKPYSEFCRIFYSRLLNVRFAWNFQAFI